MTTKFLRCPVCGDEGARRLESTRVETHMGQTGAVPHWIHECVACGSDYATAQDMRDNRRAMVRFQKGIEGIPLGCEIRALRLQLGLSQERMAHYLGGGEVSFSKYEADDLIPREAMVTLLRLLIAYPDTMRRIQGLEGAQVSVANYTIPWAAEDKEWAPNIDVDEIDWSEYVESKSKPAAVEASTERTIEYSKESVVWQ